MRQLFGDVKRVYDIGEMICHYKNTRTGSITGSFTVSGTASGAAPQLIWESRVDANDYTSIQWNGTILYCTKAKAGFTTEYVTIAATLVADSVHTYRLDSFANWTLQLYLDGVGASAGLGVENVGTTVTLGTWSDGGTTWNNNGATGILVYTDGGGAVANRVYLGAANITSYTSGTVNVPYFGTGYQSPPASGTGLKYGISIPTTANLKTYLYSSAFNGAVAKAGLSLKEIYNSTSSAFPPVITGSYTT